MTCAGLLCWDLIDCWQDHFEIMYDLVTLMWWLPHALCPMPNHYSSCLNWWLDMPFKTRLCKHFPSQQPGNSGMLVLHPLSPGHPDYLPMWALCST
jgi:hypothetical protein